LSALLDLIDALSAFESPKVFYQRRESDALNAARSRVALHLNRDRDFLPKS
jgi:hypothetical protein